MNSLINREEIRRLQKAARDNNKSKLWEWAKRYEDYVDSFYRQEYEKKYQEEVQNSVNNFIVAIIYTLKYSEELKIDDDGIKEFMCDVIATVDMYRTGESNPEQFVKELNGFGIILEHYDYTKIYKDRINELDELIIKYRKLVEDSTNSNEVGR